MIDVWNSLPDDVISANTAFSFELRLDEYWKDQDILYNYEAKLDVRLRGNCGVEELVL